MSPRGGDAASAARAAAYWNPSLRAIQLEHVYTICFERCEIGTELAMDAALMAEVGHLKARYLGYAFDELVSDLRAEKHLSNLLRVCGAWYSRARAEMRPRPCPRLFAARACR